MQKWGKTDDPSEDIIPPNEWLNHFQTLLTEGTEAPEILTNELKKLENEPYFSQLDYSIEISEIEGALKRLNKRASPGPDKVSGKLLDAGKTQLLPVLSLFFNKLFAHASQPAIFAVNFLKSIFKKGNDRDPDNYRGIAVGSALGKLFELILLDRLEKILPKYHPISMNQIGFKKAHRTADHIFVIKSIVDKIVKHGNQKLWVAFIDFRKAYDRINRGLLYLKLQKIGIKGLFYKNIKAIHDPISYLVKVKGGYLNPIHSRLGLKQGGVLSPLLFNLFIDDIKDIFEDSCDPVKLLSQPLSHLLYADDLVLMSTTEGGLKKCLQKLESYCDLWQLKVNISKSKIMIFNTSGRVLSGPSFTFQGNVLEKVKSYCYLGVDVACSGSFKTARANLAEKAQKAMSPLLSTIAQFNIPCEESIKLFHSVIRPIALYSSEILSSLTHHQLQAMSESKSSLLEYMISSYTATIHHKFLKYILGVKKNCATIAILGELGELPLYLHALTSMIFFWHRTKKMSDNTLVKQTLDFISNDPTINSEWLATVKFLMNYLKLENVFRDPLNTEFASLKRMVKEKFKEKIVNEWFEQLTGDHGGKPSKLRFYKVFKKSFTREPYLNILKDYKLRKLVTKFRCSDHILEVEIGRHKKVEYEQRICKICNADVETEIHFLQACPIYNHLRVKYLNIHTLDSYELLQCTEVEVVYNVANFLEKAFKVRKRELTPK